MSLELKSSSRRARLLGSLSAVAVVVTGLVVAQTNSVSQADDAVGDVGTVLPARLLDTRSNGETVDGEFEAAGKVAAGSFTKVQIAGRGNVPADAVGVELNITSIQNEGRGFATLYPCTTTPPTASTLNYTPGVNIANATTVALNTAGEVCVFTSSTSHYALDAVAYIPAGSDVGTVLPARLLDTRSNGETVDGEFEAAGKVAAGSFTKVQIAGRGNVPADAVGVELNITSIQNEGRGFATLYPCTTTPPTASTLNYTPGVNIANATTVALNTAGEVCVFTSSTSHYALDAVAYIPAGSDVGTVLPARLLDTRSNGETVDGEFEAAGKVAAGSFTKVQIAGRGNVPADAVGVELNITSIQNEGRGFATLYPCTTTPPTASTLNYTPGVNIANATTVALNTAGEVCVFTSSTSHYALDVVAFVARGSDGGAGTTSSPPTTEGGPDTLAGIAITVSSGYNTTVEIDGVADASVAEAKVDFPGLTFQVLPNQPGEGFRLLVNPSEEQTPEDQRLSLAIGVCEPARVPCIAPDRNVVLPVTVVGGRISSPDSSSLAIADRDRWVEVDGTSEIVLEDEITVVLAVGSGFGSFEALVGSFDGQVVGYNSTLAVAQVRVLASAMSAAIAELRSSALVHSADQSRTARDLTHGSAAPVQPPPPRYPDDWSDDLYDQRWPFIRHGAVDAWNITTGSPLVEVGVFDQGVMSAHPDLLPNVASYRSFDSPQAWRSLADRDRNGDWKVFNHGTHVAGTACGAQNGQGLVGVAWDCKLRVTDIGNNFYLGLPILAAQLDNWLVKYPRMRVVNMSFGTVCGAYASESARESFRRVFARHDQVVFVVSAGNCGVNLIHAVPAALSYEFANVVSVGAVDREGQLWSSSNTGAEVHGPGVGVWSSTHDCPVDRAQECVATYGPKTGTSMAAPFVTGTVALMLAKSPTQSTGWLVGCLQGSQRAAPGGPPAVDVLYAVLCAGNPQTTIPED